MFSFWSISNLLSVSTFICICGVLFFRKQFLVSLLSLEYAVLNLYIIIIIILTHSMQSPSISFFMLVLSACEAALGLSILVIMTRCKGSDVLGSIGIYNC